MKKLHDQAKRILADLELEIKRTIALPLAPQTLRALRHLNAAKMHVECLQMDISEASFFRDRALQVRRSMKELSKPKQPKRK